MMVPGTVVVLLSRPLRSSQAGFTSTEGEKHGSRACITRQLDVLLTPELKSVLP